MANRDAPRGFRLIGTLSGRQPQLREYYIPSTDNVAVFVGDAVKLGGGADGVGVPTCAQAAATNQLLGVVTGINQVKGMTDANFSLYRTYRPASVGMYVTVCDDPDAEYEIQADDVGATLAAADVGLNASLIVAAGDTVTGMSGMELDTESKHTNVLELKILGLAKRPDNEPFVANQKVRVMLNNRQLGSVGTAGV